MESAPGIGQNPGAEARQCSRVLSSVLGLAGVIGSGRGSMGDGGGQWAASVCEEALVFVVPGLKPGRSASATRPRCRRSVAALILGGSAIAILMFLMPHDGVIICRRHDRGIYFSNVGCFRPRVSFALPSSDAAPSGRR